MRDEPANPTGTSGATGDAGGSQGGPAQPQRHGPPPTPFDHPLFLPALLVAGMLWFGYDGWLNSDPEMQEHKTFNQVGFALLTLGAAWFGWKGWHEWQAERREKSAPPRPGPGA